MIILSKTLGNYFFWKKHSSCKKVDKEWPILNVLKNLSNLTGGRSVDHLWSVVGEPRTKLACGRLWGIDPLHHLNKDHWITKFLCYNQVATLFFVYSIINIKLFFFPLVIQISVWRRFSDFKKLHRELLKIYTQKHAQEKFPPFPKATFFGRLTL